MLSPWISILGWAFTLTKINHASATPLPRADCNNFGWQYAIFNLTESSTFDPTYMKSPAAGGQGKRNLVTNNVTTTLSGINEAGLSNYNINIYGNPAPISVHDFALIHRGYLCAATSGIYNFSVSAVDDIYTMWVGDAAKSGWDNSNAAFTTRYGSSPCGSVQGSGYGSFSTYLQKGRYLPVRIMFAQGGYGAVFNMAITEPTGNVIFDVNHYDSTYIMKYMRTGTAAPPFPNDWGEEM